MFLIHLLEFSVIFPIHQVNRAASQWNKKTPKKSIAATQPGRSELAASLAALPCVLAPPRACSLLHFRCDFLPVRKIKK
jgi:hypothetical protein